MSLLRLPPLPTIRDLIRLYKLRAIKQLSQNFLLDERICNKIVKAAGGVKRFQNSEVCEVGPGPGSITRSILNAGVKKLIVIEKDERFTPTLELLADASEHRLDFILGDVLSFDMSRLFASPRSEWNDHSPNIHLVGNLPFNIATPLIIRWLRDISTKENAWSYGRVPMTLTFQQEVAERIVAKEGSDMRCRLSVMCQSWCQPNLKFTIKGASFVPKPDVDVGVVHLVPKRVAAMRAPFPVVEKFVRQVFSYRQKYCRRGVEMLFPVAIRDAMTSELFSRCDINPEARAYNLSVDEFSIMVDIYWDMCQREPRLFDYNHRATLSERGEDEWLAADVG